MKFWDTFGAISFIIKCRVEGLRDIGPCVSSFSSFLFLQGIETLGMRMDRHIQNAVAVAQHLEKHAKVEWVKYASLPSRALSFARSAEPRKALARYFRSG